MKHYTVHFQEGKHVWTDGSPVFFKPIVSNKTRIPFKIELPEEHMKILPYEEFNNSRASKPYCYAKVRLGNNYEWKLIDCQTKFRHGHIICKYFAPGAFKSFSKEYICKIPGSSFFDKMMNYRSTQFPTEVGCADGWSVFHPKKKVCSICIKHMFKHGRVSFHHAKELCKQEGGVLCSQQEG